MVHALPTAWWAITHADHQGDARHLAAALELAVCAGGDTDTTAAIAGALLGARWGASAVPAAWRRLLHGWPGMNARDLVRLAVLTAAPYSLLLDRNPDDVRRAMPWCAPNRGLWAAATTADTPVERAQGAGQGTELIG